MLDGLIRWSLQQRPLVVILGVVLLLAGAMGLGRLAVDAFPDVTNVQVQIAAEVPGRPPPEVERFVTVPIEVAMRGLPGLTEMRSLNRNGVASITLVFTDRTDVFFARQLVLERLIEVTPRMPPGIVPVLGPITTGLGEVYQYTLERPDDGDRTLSVDELRLRRDVQDWIVRPMLRSVPGVAEINTQGGFVKQYQVIPDPDRMRHYGISIRDLVDAVSLNNGNSSGGALFAGGEQFLVRGTGLIETLDDIRRIVLKEHAGVPVKLDDVADVVIGEEVRAGASVKNGRTESVAGIVQMVRGGNAREVVARIKNKVAEMNADPRLMGGLRIVPFYDRTMLVDAALSNVGKVLVEGIVLVVVVLFLFLGDVRSSLIVVSTLVLTPLVTFLVMGQIDLSANLMSLGGLAIAIGLMVDGSVVVVENAFSRLGATGENFRGRLTAVREATLEVGKPVLFGVGIIILVFLPLLSLEGMEGKLFAPLALTIAIALTISLVLSLTLSPVLCSFFLRGGEEHDTWLLRLFKRPYVIALDIALHHGKKVAAAAVLAMAAAVACVPLLGTSFIPVMKEGQLTPVIARVPRIAIDESIRIEREALTSIMQIPGIVSAVSRLGRGESPADAGQPHESDPIVTLAPREQWPDGWTQDTFADAIRERLEKLPGIEFSVSQPIAARVDEMVSGVRSQVAVKVFGDDLDVLGNLGREISHILRTMPGAVDLRTERVSGQNYLTAKVRREEIARYGINVEDVHDVIESAIRGSSITTIFEGERRYDLAVRFPLERRASMRDVGDIAIKSASGAIIRLRDLADIQLLDGPPQIAREDGKRRLVIGVNVQDRDLGGFVADARERIAREVRMPAGYYLEWGGQFENMERAMKRLAIIIPVTIAAIFFLLFLLFGAVRYALLIILVLPLAAIGGVFGLLVSGEYLSVPAAVGFINLWGIAVLNGVVLVSRIRELRLAGQASTEAVRAGCLARFRPVMMTATVAMLALIPMLFSTGPGSEVTRPLAVVVIGGLISSTTLTLLVLPVVYRWFEGRSAA
ncbi:MAG: efflux RND transporter permease subunit [Betaproteobacteria bacterium]|nr:efflux RND transporter permease subunit [Betaproteobacteria bacterium]